VRPSTCPSSPAPSVRSQKPICHRSATTSQISPPSGPATRRNFAFPRRVSSMPRCSTDGAAAGNAAAACAVNAACTIGQETSWSRADWITVRPRSATAVPADSRSLHVSRERGGIWGSDSVNVRRAQSGRQHFQRRLVHVRSVRRPATGRSRGLVRTQPCGCSDRKPQPGQHRACSSAVTRASIEISSPSNLTEATRTPASPNRRVVSLTKPVAFSRTSLSQQHEDSQSATGASRPSTP
jgi:hypothetical protein